MEYNHRLILNNIEVAAAVGQPSKAPFVPSESQGTRVTLVLQPEQAEVLEDVREAGIIRLVRRSKTDRMMNFSSGLSHK